jgi:hypothetical protein
VKVPQTSLIVGAQFLDLLNVDLSPFNHDQPFFREFVQYAREVFLRQVEAQGDFVLAANT